jgi:hypothetical protein
MLRKSIIPPEHPQMANAAKAKFTSYGQDLSLLKDERLVALHSYWLSLHSGDALPSRKQLDPLHLPDGLLGYVSLFNVVNKGNGQYRFFFRLAGTASYNHGVMFKRISGNELHDVLPPGEIEPILQDWIQVVKTQKPFAATGTSLPFKCGPMPWEAIALPLSSDGATV